MKNKVLLFLICTFSLDNLYAQNFNYWCEHENLDKYLVIDSAYLKCSYKLVYLKDSLKPNDKSTDLQILQIGKNLSKYYSQYALDYNHFITNYLKKNPDAVPNIKEKGAWRFELFKNYPQGKETVTDIASMLFGNYMYEEDLPVLNWKIANEKQTILSYNCQKATVSFRGREYIAWFTSDIPIPNGPWKFGGLPGLILKLSDTKNNFVYECTGLERLKTKEAIKFYKVEYAKLSRSDLNKLYRNFHDDVVAYIRKVTNSPDTHEAKLRISYNPIELE